MDLQTDYIIDEDTVDDIIMNYHFFDKIHVDMENTGVLFAFLQRQKPEFRFVVHSSTTPEIILNFSIVNTDDLWTVAPAIKCPLYQEKITLVYAFDPWEIVEFLRQNLERNAVVIETVGWMFETRTIPTSMLYLDKNEDDFIQKINMCENCKCQWKPKAILNRIFDIDRYIQLKSTLSWFANITTVNTNLCRLDNIEGLVGLIESLDHNKERIFSSSIFRYWVEDDDQSGEMILRTGPFTFVCNNQVFYISVLSSAIWSVDGAFELSRFWCRGEVVDVTDTVQDECVTIKLTFIDAKGFKLQSLQKRDKYLNQAAEIVKGFSSNNENDMFLVIKKDCIQSLTVWSSNDINNLKNLSNIKKIRINLNDKEEIPSVIEMLDWITNNSIYIEINSPNGDWGFNSYRFWNKLNIFNNVRILSNRRQTVERVNNEWIYTLNENSKFKVIVKKVKNTDATLIDLNPIAH